MVIPEPWHEMVEARARMAFAFLEEQPSFRFERDEGSASVTLAYVSLDWFLEVHLDFHEASAFVELGRTEDGERPRKFTGVLTRRHLVNLLEAKDGTTNRTEHIRSVQRRSGPEAMCDQIDLFASVVHDERARLAGLIT
jgi:hypothetical protein